MSIQSRNDKPATILGNRAMSYGGLMFRVLLV
jgi:hypothetical protein